VILGKDSIGSLFSKKQKKFYKAHAPEDIALDDLLVLGPINILKLKFESEGFDRSLVAELWIYPNGARIFELSTKCMPQEAFQMASTTRSHLSQRGIDLEGEQQTKTRTALEYFAAQNQKDP